MPIFDRMPSVFIIGVAKACTTALYNYLAQRTLRSSSPKSRSPGTSVVVNYTQGGSRLVRRQVFWGAENYPVRAEAKPHYLYWSEKVAPRIKEAFRETGEVHCVLP